MLTLLNVVGQAPQITDDTVVLNITLEDFSGKKVQGKVLFENLRTHKVTSCATNKDGLGQCKLPVSESYSVKAPNSTDSYEYTIPEFAATPTALTFKFNFTEQGAVTKPKQVAMQQLNERKFRLAAASKPGSVGTGVNYAGVTANRQTMEQEIFYGKIL